MRSWGRVVAAVIAVGFSLLVEPAAGATASHPGGVPDTCPEVLAGRPTGGLQKLTVPVAGSVVARGEAIRVTLRWDPTIFAASLLHKALDCVTVDGDPANGLSIQERDVTNAGEFTTTMTVPDGLADGARLCDRGFVSGATPGGAFAREKSNDVCFIVHNAPAPAPATAPDVSASPAPRSSAPREGSGPATQLPVPAAPVTAPDVVAPTGQAFGGTVGSGAPAGTEVAGAVEVAPGAGPMLPRTGAPIKTTAVSGLAATLAGLVVRRTARRSRPSPRRYGRTA